MLLAAAVVLCQIRYEPLPAGVTAEGPVHRTYDWTQGCVAVTSAEIRELWRAVPDGTPIEIRP
jgi:hypothetical protein